MSCLDPPVTAAELAATAPGEDDDWMCRACDARVDAFYALNAVADTHVDAATATWRDVFPAEAALNVEQRGPGQANDPAKNANAFGDSFGNAALDADWASDESDDEDFGGDLDALSDDGADDEDEPLSGSARGSGDDSGGDSGDEATSSGRPSKSASPEVLLGKRRRAPVDYRKLNDEMFGTGEAFEGEAEDEKTGGWGPASPKKKVARLGMKTANAKSAKSKQARVAPNPKKNAEKEKKSPRRMTPSSARRFPDATREALERAFASDAKPGASRVARLESDLGLNQHQIKVWFQNRRRKEKA
jgi:hypothetical protein